MKTIAAFVVALATIAGPLCAQEQKPVPKDSMRVSFPGCSRGYVFTVGPRSTDETTANLPEGTHLRMNGPKAVMKEIKAHEGSMIEITGLMKKGQFQPDGVSLGGGVRIRPAPGPGVGGVASAPNTGVMFIDVEGWRAIAGSCPSR